MKKFAPIAAALAIIATPLASNASTNSSFVNPSNGLAGSPALMLAGSINPYWGAGTGFHYVQPSTESGYWRSNPDGLCWNNKYGC